MAVANADNGEPECVSIGFGIPKRINQPERFSIIIRVAKRVRFSVS